jgi:hypothetical protein
MWYALYYLFLFHFHRYHEQQEAVAISPLILNIFVACFLEHIPYMYMHLLTMLEC